MKKILIPLSLILLETSASAWTSYDCRQVSSGGRVAYALTVTSAFKDPHDHNGPRAVRVGLYKFMEGCDAAKRSLIHNYGTGRRHQTSREFAADIRSSSAEQNWQSLPLNWETEGGITHRPPPSHVPPQPRHDRPSKNHDDAPSHKPAPKNRFSHYPITFPSYSCTYSYAVSAYQLTKNSTTYRLDRYGVEYSSSYSQVIGTYKSEIECEYARPGNPSAY